MTLEPCHTNKTAPILCPIRLGSGAVEWQTKGAKGTQETNGNSNKTCVAYRVYAFGTDVRQHGSFRKGGGLLGIENV